MLSLTTLEPVATLTIRNLDDELKARLRVRAAERGHSMEEEVRQVLRLALRGASGPAGLGTRIAARFQRVGGVDLPAVRRSAPRPSPFRP
jgi:plasmid stability protein